MLAISESKKRIAKSDLRSITNCDQIHDNIVMNIVTLKAAPYLELLFNKQTSKAMGVFAEHRVKLSSSFRYDQICKVYCYEFGHTLLHFISLT